MSQAAFGVIDLGTGVELFGAGFETSGRFGVDAYPGLWMSWRIIPAPVLTAVRQMRRLSRRPEFPSRMDEFGRSARGWRQRFSARAGQFRPFDLASNERCIGRCLVASGYLECDAAHQSRSRFAVKFARPV